MLDRNLNRDLSGEQMQIENRTTDGRVSDINQVAMDTKEEYNNEDVNDLIDEYAEYFNVDRDELQQVVEEKTKEDKNKDDDDKEIVEESAKELNKEDNAELDSEDKEEEHTPEMPTEHTFLGTNGRKNNVF